ncbi:hypothetical protein ACLMJK_008722 [Lecanora helva]
MDLLKIYRHSNLLHLEEHISNYRLGGFHPVRLGDTFQDGRYEIRHKLGWGGFSTVWLAKDKRNMQWVSIKILSADDSKVSRELDTLQLLQARSEESPRRPIVQFIDNFLHQGPNGTHQCLVFELLGPTLEFVLNDIYCGDYPATEAILEPYIILKFCEQLLQNIAFIHEVGYVHGDISISNFAFTSNNLLHMSEEDLFDVLGSPESEELVRLDGEPLSSSLPSQLVETARWSGWADEDEEDLRIIDLGLAFPEGEMDKEFAQSSTLRVPETIFNTSFDARLDLWRCSKRIYTLVLKQPPFSPWFARTDELIEQMIDLAGELPTEWQPEWAEIRQRFATERQGKTRVRKYVPPPLAAMFDEKVQDEILKPLLPVIQGLMKFRPSDRITIPQALELVRSKMEQAEMFEESDDEEMDETEMFEEAEDETEMFEGAEDETEMFEQAEDEIDD